MKINIGLVDDHQLFLKSLKIMLESLHDYNIVIEATNGEDLQTKIQSTPVLPHIMLVDVEMPVMDGTETATWVKKHYPSIKLAALSMSNREQTVMGMIKAGCCSYLLKDLQPSDLDKALKEIHTKGYYNSDLIDLSLRKSLTVTQQEVHNQITDEEKEFIQFAASDLSYKSIATLMNVSERTLESYRTSVFEKLMVKTRTGMVLEGIQHGWVKQ